MVFWDFCQIMEYRGSEGVRNMHAPWNHSMNEEKNTCCICGREFGGYGNNPWPIDPNPEHRCCDQCNEKAVVPARINLMFGKCDLN